MFNKKTVETIKRFRTILDGINNCLVSRPANPRVVKNANKVFFWSKGIAKPTVCG